MNWCDGRKQIAKYNAGADRLRFWVFEKYLLNVPSAGIEPATKRLEGSESAPSPL